jgi:hypothetical protein
VYAKPEGPISHAQRRLITLIDKRSISGVLIDTWGIPKTQMGNIYRMALNKLPVSYGVIFMLRRYLPPIAWYYDEQEALPRPIAFVPKHPPFGKKTRDKILHHETAALSIIREMKEKRELSRFCQQYRVKYYDVAGCSFKNPKKDGREGYHQRPSYRMIRSLREAIHPDLWYIFPDELTVYPDKYPLFPPDPFELAYRAL